MPLAGSLLGWAFSAVLWRHAGPTACDPWGIFGLLIAVAGLVALLEIVMLGDWLMRSQSLVSAWVQAATGNALAA